MAITERQRIQGEAASRRTKLQEQLKAKTLTQAAFNASIRSLDAWEGEQYADLNKREGSG